MEQKVTVEVLAVALVEVVEEGVHVVEVQVPGPPVGSIADVPGLQAALDDRYTEAETDALLDAKAPIDAPAFTGMVGFGGFAAGNPALKASGAALHARLGNDSGFANFQCLRVDAPNIVGGNLIAGATSQINWGGGGSRSVMKSSADGIIELYNNVSSSFGRLCFGGLTAAFPALKRAAAVLQARLADDSGFAAIQSKLVVETDAVPATASDSGTAGGLRWDADHVYLCVATDTWKRAALASW
jgi:hypothetical protein